MPFDTTQNSYLALRKVMAERTRQVVVFCGAGLSSPAKMPTWLGLRKGLLGAARKEIEHRAVNSKRDQALLDAAESESDLWRAFAHIKEVLGDTTYTAEIRREFEHADRANPPEEYCDLWRLPIAGFVTLNLDGLTKRAFSEVYGGKRVVTELSGIDCDRQPDLLSAGRQFIVNIHGVLQQTKTWIFTSEDLERLMRDAAYRVFLQSLFTTRTVLFVGITADDPAISAHLNAVKASGFSGGDHYWITHRKDSATIEWAESHQVRLIYYSTLANDHSEVRTIVKDIGRYFPPDTEAPPVVPSTEKERGFVLPAPDEVERLPAEEIRQSLNKEASRILNSNDPDRDRKYDEFWKKYSEAIHRAWSVNTEPPKNIFLGYKLTRSLTKGGFGTIYEGQDTVGSPVALKVLHNVARDDSATLQSFRRGVRAMRILSDRRVNGMVPYQAAWEIPPCAVMEFIDGPNLQEAIEAKKITSWEKRFKIAIRLVEIIKAAHSVPEAVLHRDIRPANIMLSDLWANDDEFDVVVLDFDLSWHRDAIGHSVSLAHSVNGYLAPELSGASRFSSRNALVDSYGIGMTFFFIVSGRAPLFTESQHADWIEKLQKEIGREPSKEWRSLSQRWARLVYWTTKPNQTERWDSARILGELQQLQGALKNPERNASAELAAEEILARSKEGGRLYHWNVDTLCGHFELRTGFRIELKGDESSKEVKFECDWMNIGDRKFENVKKYLGPAADRLDGIMRTGGWILTTRRSQADSVHFTAALPIERLQYPGALDRAVESVNAAVENLKLGNT